MSDGPDVTRGAAVGSVEPFAIRNDYYGGDVNVTGLIVACDLLAQLPTDLRDTLVVLPEVMFNFDKVTLDGVAQAEVVDRIKERGGRVAFATPNPPDLLDAVAAAL